MAKHLVTALSRQEFLAEFIPQFNAQISVARTNRGRWVNAMVCDWNKCPRTWKEVLSRSIPKPENMPIEAQWVMDYLRETGFKFAVETCGGYATNWGIFVTVPVIERESFLFKFAADLEASLKAARRSHEDYVNALVSEWHECYRTWKEFFTFRAPSQEGMPLETQWAMDYVREQGYRFELDKCGGRSTNWGLFVYLKKPDAA